MLLADRYLDNADYDVVRAKDRALRRRRQSSVPGTPQHVDIFTAVPASPEATSSEPAQERTIYQAPAASDVTPLAQPVQTEPPVHVPVLITPQDTTSKEKRGTRKQVEGSPEARVHQLREALAPYLNVGKLRKLASNGEHLQEALMSPNPPPEVLQLLDTLAAILRPIGRDQITSPADIASLLMVEMSHLTQEQLKVVCLSTKNHVQKIHMVYQGSVNTSPVRIAEVFREPIKLNSAAVITAHNHPSGQPDPSPEDIVLTRQLVEAGKLLQIDVLDHLVIGQGRWISLRERRLGFDH
jgi:hypothetical protein